jgi:hypothetical protein
VSAAIHPQQSMMKYIDLVYRVEKSIEVPPIKKLRVRRMR